MRTDEARCPDRLIFEGHTASWLTWFATGTEAGSMMQTLSARPTHAHRNPRIAIAACALLVSLLVLLAGAERAMARSAPTLPAPAPVATAGPVTAPVTVPVTAPATSTTHPAPVVPGQEAIVEIPSINVSLPVVRGGQDVIDRGVAAHYEGTQWRPPTGPGRPGTYWLAAHNSTQGSPFENLPAIAVGAAIRIISPDGTVFTYEVTSRDRVGTTTTFETVYGQDPGAKRILLQTCEGAARRLLVHGILTSVTSD